MPPLAPATVVHATYLIDAPDPADAAVRIAYEQTVELPQALVTDPAILEGVVGQVESVTPVGGRHLARVIAYCR